MHPTRMSKVEHFLSLKFLQVWLASIRIDRFLRRCFVDRISTIVNNPLGNVEIYYSDSFSNSYSSTSNPRENVKKNRFFRSKYPNCLHTDAFLGSFSTHSVLTTHSISKIETIPIDAIECFLNSRIVLQSKKLQLHSRHFLFQKF